MLSPSERRLALATFVVALALAAPLPGSNEGRTLALVKAIAAGRLSIDPDAGGTVDRAVVRRVPAAFAALGAAAPAAVRERSHVYSGGAPGLAFLLVPFHEVGRRVLPPAALALFLVALAGALPLALGSVAVKRAVERATGASEDAALAAGALHALGTLALPYATRLFAHSLVTGLVAAALALLLRPGARRAALAGFAAGIAVACDLGAVVALAPLALLSFSGGGWRRSLAFLAGGLPLAVALGAYDHACFGSPLRTAYDFRDDAAVRALLAHGVYGFTAPSPWVLFQLVAGERRGFLVTQPIALVGLAGLVAALRERGPGRRDLAIALGGAGLVLLVHASRVRDWHGGWSHGPRYAMTALPFLALGLPRGLALLGRAARPVALASLFLAWVGATVDWTYVGSARTNVQAFLLLGPRTRGLADLLLGSGTTAATRGTSLVAAVALAVASGGAARLLRRSRREVVLATLLPVALAAPFQLLTFQDGPRAVHASYRALYRDEVARALDDARSVHDARDLAVVAEFLGDPPLALRAWDQVLALDSSDRDARERARRLRERLAPR